MKRIVLAAVFAFAGVAGASAQDMSCADFAAMDEDGQMEVTQGMATESLAGQGTTAAAANIARDAGASDDAKPAEVMASDIQPGTEGSDAEMPNMTAAIAEVCAANPDLTVREALVSL